MIVWEALSEDIAMAAGGPMGSPTTENWRALFETSASARAFCERDYVAVRAGGDGPDHFRWRKRSDGWTSGDLGHVMYTVGKVKVRK